MKFSTAVAVAVIGFPGFAVNGARLVSVCSRGLLREPSFARLLLREPSFAKHMKSYRFECVE